MKVFMLGWEFPPHISGGLGTACYGLTKGLDEVGVEVSFVLPTAVPVEGQSHVKLRSPATLAELSQSAESAGLPGAEAEAPRGAAPQEAGLAEVEGVFQHVQFHRLDACLQPYASPVGPEEAVRHLQAKQIPAPSAVPEELQPGSGRAQATPPQVPGEPLEPAATAEPLPTGSFTPGAGAQYTGDLMGQVYRYARLAVELARHETFDIVHAHDWMTYPAGLAVAAALRKPLVVHVHSTEFDRAGMNINQQVYEMERMGMQAADCVVCVSHLTGRLVASRYGVPKDRLHVVYNAVQLPDSDEWKMKPIRHTEKIVLFLGRVTMQKGPEYFLRAAKKVVEKFQNVRFVMAGSGDMMAQCVREVADLRLGRYVTFTGFLRGQDVDRIFGMADLYVMPSVSEPFGIAPLEALSHNVPVIISKQSGVSEVLRHVLKVDFWDVNEMANKILAVLRHPPLQRTLRQHGQIELRKLSWRQSATQLKKIYSRLHAGAAP